MRTLRLKTHHFHTKLPYQNPMLRQIEWWVQNGPIKKDGVLPVTNLFFWKFCFSFRTSYKELIWCTNEPNAHIRTFRKRWSFIWRCFFPVSILSPLNANPAKWPNTLKQFVGNLATNCLSVCGHFINLVLKGLNVAHFCQL